MGMSRIKNTRQARTERLNALKSAPAESTGNATRGTYKKITDRVFHVDPVRFSTGGGSVVPQAIEVTYWRAGDNTSWEVDTVAICGLQTATQFSELPGQVTFWPHTMDTAPRWARDFAAQRLPAAETAGDSLVPVRMGF
jgi:hypothetical protein